MFKKVLIANRGEIALRILRACKSLNLKTVIVFSSADKDAHYIKLADESCCIGPGPSIKSYMNHSAILFAAKVTGADAIHPGYGFLSENAEFAEKVKEAGLVFIGPTCENIRMMGDKITARSSMLAAEIPCVPGSKGALSDDIEETKLMAANIGYPVIIKASSGGGGRGMRIVRQESELLNAVKITQEEAKQAFGNADVYLEKFLMNPRHIEIQVVSDSFGDSIWLGSRDCSLQRRHQKVIEEAPAKNIDQALLNRVAEQCAKACVTIGYLGVGTFEFLYENGEFYFIEMNTRIQVEHTITEITSGVDIVQLQLRVALGEKLPFKQSDIRCVGHAIECRINAEDPSTFMPTPGAIIEWSPPGGHGVRVDTHIHAGALIPPHYDSMIAKIITHGADRSEAIRKMCLALDETVIVGTQSNIPLHKMLLKDPLINQGSVDIHYLETLLGAADNHEEEVA